MYQKARTVAPVQADSGEFVIFMTRDPEKLGFRRCARLAPGLEGKAQPDITVKNLPEFVYRCFRVVLEKELLKIFLNFADSFLYPRI